jgi:hypothetical protein
MIVSEEHPASRHGVFRVMYAFGSSIRRNGRHEVSIRRGGSIGVNHREKVITYFRAIARPNNQIVTLSRRLRLAGVARAVACEESKDQADMYAQ